MLSSLAILGVARKIGWRGWLLISLAGAMLFLWTRGNRFKGRYAEQLEINHGLQWDLSLAEAKFDSIVGIGQYSEPETLWQTQMVIRTDTITGKVDSFYADIPDVRGHIEIDTSKWFGPEGEKFGVRVYGLFYWPEEFSYKNRLLIDPLGFEKTPETAPERRSEKTWGIGLAAAISSQQRLYGGVSVAIKRTSVFGLRSFSGSDWMIGVSYQILKF